MAQLRRLYIAELEDNAELKEAHRNYPDQLIAVMACAVCTGFLATLEDDTKALRGIIDELDAGMNPDKEHFKAPHATPAA